MAELLNSDQTGDEDELRRIREQTVDKWDKLGFLDNLKGHLKEDIAKLYESEASTLLPQAKEIQDMTKEEREEYRTNIVKKWNSHDFLKKKNG